MRIMGLDCGDKTIGIAVSDELGWTAQGIEVMVRRSLEADMERIRQRVADYQVLEIVVGLPRNMDGTISEQALRCMEFARQLQETLQLPVHLWDERLSTKAAERALLEADVGRKKRKQVIDKLAAVMILQSYLDSKQMG